jgi:hypothetical protein
MYLRQAWDAPDPRHRDWYIFKLREIYGEFRKPLLGTMTGKAWPWDFARSDPDEVPTRMNRNTTREILARYRNIGGRAGLLAALDTAVRGASEPRSKETLTPEMIASWLSSWNRTWSLRPKEPPPQTPFEQAAFQFHRVAARARHCNNFDCPAPYFFARRKGQKYCTPKCAGVGEREAKRRWWHENKHRIRKPKRKA